MLQRHDLLDIDVTFGDIDQYGNALSKVFFFLDFLYELCPFLLPYASKLTSSPTLSKVEEDDFASEPPAVEKETRISQLAKHRCQRLIAFFNSEDGITLRLKVCPHIQIFPVKLTHSLLCCCSVERRRNKFMFTTCNVHLCVRTSKDCRKFCRTKWHDAKWLEKIKVKSDKALETSFSEN